MNQSAIDLLTPGSTSTLLITLLRDDSADAWAAFHRLYQPLVLHWCQKFGVTRDDAEDVYQESCLSVRKSLNGFVLREEKSTFRGWLWTIVRRRIADFHRSSATQFHARGGDASAELDSLPERPPEDLTEYMKWLVRGIEEARRKVTPRVFAYAEFTFRDAWTEAQIANYFGVSIFAVIKGRARFLALLRGILGETVPPDFRSAAGEDSDGE